MKVTPVVLHHQLEEKMSASPLPDFEKLTEMAENGRRRSDNSSCSNGSYFCMTSCVTIATVATQERERGFVQRML